MTLKRTGIQRTEWKRKASTKSAAFSRAERKEAGAVAKLKAGREAKTPKPKSAPKSTPAERAHLAAVAELGCCLCEFLGLGATPAEVHHVRARHGWGRSGHFATIPLCPTHHRGQPGGVHDMGREEFTGEYGISEIELLERVTLRITNSKAPTDSQSVDASIKYL